MDQYAKRLGKYAVFIPLSYLIFNIPPFSSKTTSIYGVSKLIKKKGGSSGL